MSAIDPLTLEQVDAALRTRYDARLDQFGRDPRTLGWDSVASQRQRFSIAAESVEFDGRSILDIGCGLGDFLDFLETEQLASAPQYTGFDINPRLIQECRERFPAAAFETRNVLIAPPAKRMWNIVTIFGVLNFRFREFDNRDFAREMIGAAYALARDVLVVDMLSARTAAEYDSEDFVYYYDPADMLRVALELTPHVTLRHDYPRIPQREFTLILRRSPVRVLPELRR